MILNYIENPHTSINKGYLHIINSTFKDDKLIQKLFTNEPLHL